MSKKINSSCMNALDIILDEILEEVELIKNNINKNYNGVSEELNAIYSIYSSVKDFDTQLEKIKEKLSKVEVVKDNIKILMRSKLLSEDKNKLTANAKNNMSLEDINIIDAEPSVIMTSSSITCITSAELSPSIMINCPLYFCNKNKYFSIKINNKILKGNLVDFYNMSEIRNSSCVKVFKCKWETLEECKKRKKYINCKFYHKEETQNILLNDFKKICIGKKDILFKNIYKLCNKDQEIIKTSLMHCILLFQLYC